MSLNISDIRSQASAIIEEFLKRLIKTLNERSPSEGYRFTYSEISELIVEVKKDFSKR